MTDYYPPDTCPRCRWCGFRSSLETDPLPDGLGVECDDAERCRKRMDAGLKGPELEAEC